MNATRQNEPSPFDVEDAFADYMRKVAPHVAEREIQYRESRRAFIAGARRLFVYMTVELPKLSDSDAEIDLLRLDADMCEYWKRACEDKD